MKRVVVFIALFSFCLPVVSAFAHAQTGEHMHKPHPHRHKEYAKVKNPIPVTGQSVREGKGLFEKHCTACHGKEGKGGSAPDLTDNLWIHGHSDGEIFHVIMDGVEGTAMRGYKDDLTKKMRWHLVNYIKSIRKEQLK